MRKFIILVVFVGSIVLSIGCSGSGDNVNFNELDRELKELNYMVDEYEKKGLWGGAFGFEGE